MGRVSLVTRLLGLDAARWARIGPTSFWSALGSAAAASLLLALNRFGGVVIDAPRAFLRMALVGIYGWIGLACAIWLAGLATTDRHQQRPPRHQPRSPTVVLQETLVAVGLAHTPLLVLGLTIFAAAGLLQLLGPGLVVAVFVLAFWFPATLVMATRSTFGLGMRHAIAVVAVPYTLWYLTAGQHLLDRVQHLL